MPRGLQLPFARRRERSAATRGWLFVRFLTPPPAGRARFALLSSVPRGFASSRRRVSAAVCPRHRGKIQRLRHRHFATEPNSAVTAVTLEDQSHGICCRVFCFHDWFDFSRTGTRWHATGLALVLAVASKSSTNSLLTPLDAQGAGISVIRVESTVQPNGAVVVRELAASFDVCTDAVFLFVALFAATSFSLFSHTCPSITQPVRAVFMQLPMVPNLLGIEGFLLERPPGTRPARPRQLALPAPPAPSSSTTELASRSTGDGAEAARQEAVCALTRLLEGGEIFTILHSKGSHQVRHGALWHRRLPFVVRPTQLTWYQRRYRSPVEPVFYCSAVTAPSRSAPPSPVGHRGAA